MDNVFYKNTHGCRADIARIMEISPQGYASKLNAQPANFIVENIRALVLLKKQRKAAKIWADLSARVEDVLNGELKTLPLNERVRLLNEIIAMEVEAATGTFVNRHELLDAWRDIRVLTGGRIVELTELLEGERRTAARAAAVEKKTLFERFMNRLKRFVKL